MNFVYLILIILGVSFQNVFKKAFNLRNPDGGVFFFGLLSSFFALAFFALTSSGFSFEAGVLPYSIGFGTAYAVATVAAFLAFCHGSLSVSSLVISYSLLMPTLYGLLFLNDSVGTTFYIGMALLIVSLMLINKPSEHIPVTKKWIVFIVLAFVGNGMCSVVQKMQQDAFDGAYKNEFMIIALAIVCVVMLGISLVTERKYFGLYMKSGWHLGVMCGVMNGAVNLFVMILSGKMPVSLMFPLISAGGIIITYLISRYFYKEKLTKTQFIGFIAGVVSVVFLNI